MAVAQEWKATCTMTFLSEKKSRRILLHQKGGRSATQLHQSDEGRRINWCHFNSNNSHQLLAGESWKWPLRKRCIVFRFFVVGNVVRARRSRYPALPQTLDDLGPGHTETNFGVSPVAEPPLRRKPPCPRRRFFESGTSAFAYSLLRKHQLLTFFWRKVWRKLLSPCFPSSLLSS